MPHELQKRAGNLGVPASSIKYQRLSVLARTWFAAKGGIDDTGTVTTTQFYIRRTDSAGSTDKESFPLEYANINKDHNDIKTLFKQVHNFLDNIYPAEQDIVHEKIRESLKLHGKSPSSSKNWEADKKAYEDLFYLTFGFSEWPEPNAQDLDIFGYATQCKFCMISSQLEGLPLNENAFNYIITGTKKPLNISVYGNDLVAPDASCVYIQKESLGYECLAPTTGGAHATANATNINHLLTPAALKEQCEASIKNIDLDLLFQDPTVKDTLKDWQTAFKNPVISLEEYLAFDGSTTKVAIDNDNAKLQALRTLALFQKLNDPKSEIALEALNTALTGAVVWDNVADILVSGKKATDLGLDVPANQAIITAVAKEAYAIAKTEPLLQQDDTFTPDIEKAIKGRKNDLYLNAYAMISNVSDAEVNEKGIVTQAFLLPHGTKVPVGTDLTKDITPLFTDLKVYLDKLVDGDEKEWIQQQIKSSLLEHSWTGYESSVSDWETMKTAYIALYKGTYTPHLYYPQTNDHDLEILSRAMQCRVCKIIPNAPENQIKPGLVTDSAGVNLGLKMYGQRFGDPTKDRCIYIAESNVLQLTPNAKAAGLDKSPHALWTSDYLQVQLAAQLIEKVGIDLLRDVSDPTVVKAWQNQLDNAAFDLAEHIKANPRFITDSLPQYRAKCIQQLFNKNVSYAKLQELADKDLKAKNFEHIVEVMCGGHIESKIAAALKGAEQAVLESLISQGISNMLKERREYLEPIRLLLGENSDFEKIVDQALRNGWNPKTVTQKDVNGKDIPINYQDELLEIFTTQDPKEEKTWSQWLFRNKGKVQESKDQIRMALKTLKIAPHVDVYNLLGKKDEALKDKAYNYIDSAGHTATSRMRGWLSGALLDAQAKHQGVYGGIENFSLAYVLQKGLPAATTPAEKATREATIKSVIKSINGLNTEDWGTKYSKDDDLLAAIVEKCKITSADEKAFKDYMTTVTSGMESPLAYVKKNQQYTQQIRDLSLPEDLKRVLMSRAPLEQGELSHLIQLFDPNNLFDWERLNQLNANYRDRTGNPVPILTTEEYTNLLTSDVQSMLSASTQLSHNPDMFKTEYQVTSGFENKKDKYGRIGAAAGAGLGAGAGLSAQFAPIPYMSNLFGLLTGSIAGGFSLGTLAVPGYFAGAGVMAAGFGLLGYLAGRQKQDTRSEVITHNWGERDVLEELENVFVDASLKDDEGKIARLADQMEGQIDSALTHVNNSLLTLQAGTGIHDRIVTVRDRLKKALENPKLDSATRTKLTHLRKEMKTFITPVAVMEINASSGKKEKKEQSPAQKMAKEFLAPLMAMQEKLKGIQAGIKRVKAETATVWKWDATTKLYEQKVLKGEDFYDKTGKIKSTDTVTKADQKEKIIRVSQEFHLVKKTEVEKYHTTLKASGGGTKLKLGFEETKTRNVYTTMQKVEYEAVADRAIQFDNKKTESATFRTIFDMENNQVSISCVEFDTGSKEPKAVHFELSTADNTSRADYSQLIVDRMTMLIERCVEEYGSLPNRMHPIVIYPDNDIAIQQALAYRELLKSVYPGKITDASFVLMGVSAEKIKKFNIVASYEASQWTPKKIAGMRVSTPESYLGRPPYINLSACSPAMQKAMSDVGYSCPKNDKGVYEMSSSALGGLTQNLNKIKAAMSLGCCQDVAGRVLHSVLKAQNDSVIQVDKSAILNNENVSLAVNKNKIGTESITALSNVTNMPATAKSLLADTVRHATQSKDAQSEVTKQNALIATTSNASTEFKAIAVAKKAAIEKLQLDLTTAAKESDRKDVETAMLNIVKTANEVIIKSGSTGIKALETMVNSKGTYPLAASEADKLKADGAAEEVEINARIAKINAEIKIITDQLPLAQTELDKLTTQKTAVNDALKLANNAVAEAQQAANQAKNALNFIDRQVQIAHDAHEAAKLALSKIDVTINPIEHAAAEKNVGEAETHYKNAVLIQTEAKKEVDTNIAAEVKDAVDHVNEIKTLLGDIEKSIATVNKQIIAIKKNETEGNKILTTVKGQLETAQAKQKGGEALALVLAEQAVKAANDLKLKAEKAKTAADKAQEEWNKINPLNPPSTITVTEYTPGHKLYVANKTLADTTVVTKDKSAAITTALSKSNPLIMAAALVDEAFLKNLATFSDYTKALFDANKEALDYLKANVSDKITEVTTADTAIGNGTRDDKLHHRANKIAAAAEAAKKGVTWTGANQKTVEDKINAAKKTSSEADTLKKEALNVIGSTGTKLQKDNAELTAALEVGGTYDVAVKDAAKELLAAKAAILAIATELKKEQNALKTTGEKTYEDEFKSAKKAIESAKTQIENLKKALVDAGLATDVNVDDHEEIKTAKLALKTKVSDLAEETVLKALHEAKKTALANIQTAIDALDNSKVKFDDPAKYADDVAELKKQANEILGINTALQNATKVFSDKTQAIISAATGFSDTDYNDGVIESIVFKERIKLIEFDKLKLSIEELRDDIRPKDEKLGLGSKKQGKLVKALNTATINVDDNKKKEPDTAILLYTQKLEEAKKAQETAESEAKTLSTTNTLDQHQKVVAVRKKAAALFAEAVTLRTTAVEKIMACQIAHVNLTKAYDDLEGIFKTVTDCYGDRSTEYTRKLWNKEAKMSAENQELVEGIYAQILKSAKDGKAADKARVYKENEEFIKAHFTNVIAPAEDHIEINKETENNSLVDAKAAAKSYAEALLAELEAKKAAAMKQLEEMEKAVDDEVDGQTLAQRIETATTMATTTPPVDSKKAAENLFKLASTALTTATDTHQTAAIALNVEEQYNTAIEAIKLFVDTFETTDDSIKTLEKLKENITNIETLSDTYNTEIIKKCTAHHTNFNKEIKSAQFKLLEGNVAHQRFLIANAVVEADTLQSEATKALKSAQVIQKKAPTAKIQSYKDIIGVDNVSVSWTDPTSGNKKGKKKQSEILTNARDALEKLPKLESSMKEKVVIIQKTNAEAVAKALGVTKLAYVKAKEAAGILATNIQQNITDIDAHLKTVTTAKNDVETLNTETLKTIADQLAILKNEASVILLGKTNAALSKLMEDCDKLAQSVVDKGSVKGETDKKLTQITGDEKNINSIIKTLTDFKTQVEEAGQKAELQEKDADALILLYQARANDAAVLMTPSLDKKATLIVENVKSLIDAANLKKTDCVSRAATIEAAKKDIEKMTNNLTTWGTAAKPITEKSVDVLKYDFLTEYKDADTASTSTTEALTAAVELFKLVTTMKNAETSAAKNRLEVTKAAQLVKDITQLEEDLKAIDLKITEAETAIKTAKEFKDTKNGDKKPYEASDLKAYKEAVDNAEKALGADENAGLRAQRKAIQEAIFEKRNSDADESVNTVITGLSTNTVSVTSTLTSDAALLNAKEAALTVRAMCDKTLEGLLKKATSLNTTATGYIDVKSVEKQITSLKKNPAVKDAISGSTLAIDWKDVESKLSEANELLKNTFKAAVNTITKLKKELATTPKSQTDVEALQKQLTEAIDATKDLEEKLKLLKDPGNGDAGLVKNITDEINKAQTVANAAAEAEKLKRSEAEKRREEDAKKRKEELAVAAEAHKVEKQNQLDELAKKMDATYTSQYAANVTDVLNKITTDLDTGYSSAERTADLASDSKTPINITVEKFMAHQAAVQIKINDKTSPDNVTAKLADVLKAIDDELAACNVILGKMTDKESANGKNYAFFTERKEQLTNAKKEAQRHLRVYQFHLNKEHIAAELLLRRRMIAAFTYYIPDTSKTPPLDLKKDSALQNLLKKYASTEKMVSFYATSTVASSLTTLIVDSEEAFGWNNATKTMSDKGLNDTSSFEANLKGSKDVALLKKIIAFKDYKTTQVLTDFAEIQCRVAILEANEKVTAINAKLDNLTDVDLSTATTKSVSSLSSVKKATDVIAAAEAMQEKVLKKRDLGKGKGEQTEQAILLTAWDEAKGQANNQLTVYEALMAKNNDAYTSINGDDGIDAAIAKLDKFATEIDLSTIESSFNALTTNDPNGIEKLELMLIAINGDVMLIEEAMKALSSTASIENKPFELLEKAYAQVKKSWEALHKLDPTTYSDGSGGKTAHALKTALDKLKETVDKKQALTASAILPSTVNKGTLDAMIAAGNAILAAKNSLTTIVSNDTKKLENIKERHKVIADKIGAKKLELQEKKEKLSSEKLNINTNDTTNNMINAEDDNNIVENVKNTNTNINNNIIINNNVIDNSSIVTEENTIKLNVVNINNRDYSAETKAIRKLLPINGENYPTFEIQNNDNATNEDEFNYYLKQAEQYAAVLKKYVSENAKSVSAFNSLTKDADKTDPYLTIISGMHRLKCLHDACPNNSNAIDYEKFKTEINTDDLLMKANNHLLKIAREVMGKVNEVISGFYSDDAVNSFPKDLTEANAASYLDEIFLEQKNLILKEIERLHDADDSLNANSNNNSANMNNNVRIDEKAKKDNLDLLKKLQTALLGIDNTLDKKLETAINSYNPSVTNIHSSVSFGNTTSSLFKPSADLTLESVLKDADDSLKNPLIEHYKDVSMSQDTLKAIKQIVEMPLLIESNSTVFSAVEIKEDEKVKYTSNAEKISAIAEVVVIGFLDQLKTDYNEWNTNLNNFTTMTQKDSDIMTNFESILKLDEDKRLSNDNLIKLNGAISHLSNLFNISSDNYRSLSEAVVKYVNTWQKLYDTKKNKLLTPEILTFASTNTIK